MAMMVSNDVLSGIKTELRVCSKSFCSTKLHLYVSNFVCVCEIKHMSLCVRGGNI